MKIYSFRLLLLLFILPQTHIFAQTEDSGVVIQSFTLTDDSQDNSLLWKISGNGLSQPSYLYGTIHLIGKDDFFLSDSTRAFIERSEMVAFEINMDDIMDINAQLGLLMKAMMEGGKTLRDLLSAEDYTLVKNHFDKIGMPLFLFERIKPMFLSVLASGDMSPQSLQSGEMVSYELEIMEIAKTGNKKLGGLETIEFQMSVFDSIPYDVQAKMLVESIQSGDTGDAEFEKMVELYKNQDIQGMVDMMSTEDGIAEYEDILLTTRNKNWIPIMSEMMKQQTSFFAVGAGHLGGRDGVVSLLRKEGFSLSPVR